VLTDCGVVQGISHVTLSKEEETHGPIEGRRLKEIVTYGDGRLPSPPNFDENWNNP